MIGSPRRLDPSKYYEQMILWASLVLSVLILILLYAYTGKVGGRRRRRRKPARAISYVDNTDNPEFADTKPHAPVNARNED